MFWMKGAGGPLFLLVGLGASVMGMTMYDHFYAIAAVVSVIVTVGTVIATWAKFTQLVSFIRADLKELSEGVDKHLSNHEIHIDPKRDERRWDDLVERINRDRQELAIGMEKNFNALVRRLNQIETRCVLFTRAGGHGSVPPDQILRGFGELSDEG